MRVRRISAALGATALTAAAFSSPAGAAVRQAPAADQNGQAESYIVLMKPGQSATKAAQRLRAQGVKVTSVNKAIGMVTASSADADFRSEAGDLAGVQGVAADRTIGRAPVRKPDPVERESLSAAKAGKVGAAKAGRKAAAFDPGDPLDSKLWGMRMIQADDAHEKTLGSTRVKVGIIDTGVQGDHPDIHPNFDAVDSRNFVTDIESIDGPCETATCIDPVGEDDGGHGTHVAGTVAAAMNGFGLSGVAPKVKIVNVRAGQDSGYFFAAPTVNALTYAGSAGLDVVNMSFYVDPWLYNCEGGAPEDSPEAAADQETIIDTVTRALNYAHNKKVTLVAAAGNNHEDMANPRVDISSPDIGQDPYPRTIDNDTCSDLPTEGPHVLGVSSLGPSGKKSDFSNYTTEPDSGEIEFSAPGGWFRDYFGTSQHRVVENEILSTVPLVSLQDTEEVDEAGNITPLGEANGVIKECQATPAPGTATCGYYAYYQGTSMASPHAAGVAALTVGKHGTKSRTGISMKPNQVARWMAKTAQDHACPPGGVQEYLNEGRSAEFTARCVGTKAKNGFYGEGIVNALGVVR